MKQMTSNDWIALWHITERRDARIAAADDPLATVYRRHSGVYDLRTPNGTPHWTYQSLISARRAQALLNTRLVLDVPAE